MGSYVCGKPDHRQYFLRHLYMPVYGIIGTFLWEFWQIMPNEMQELRSAYTCHESLQSYPGFSIHIGPGGLQSQRFPASDGEDPAAFRLRAGSRCSIPGLGCGRRM
jgi:hypothetical protein